MHRVHYCGGRSSWPCARLSPAASLEGVLDFEVAGGREAAWQFLYATELMSLTSVMPRLRVHPATTTYGRSSEQQREEAGISKNLIRTAVGLEDIEDLRVDFERGTAVAHRARPSDDGSTTTR